MRIACTTFLSHIERSWIKPDPADVFKQLKSKHVKWDDIGRELNVPLDHREMLRAEGLMSSTSSKLESVIYKWVESGQSVSWDTVIEVLDNLMFTDTVETVTNYLLNDSEAKNKYKWESM